MNKQCDFGGVLKRYSITGDSSFKGFISFGVGTFRKSNNFPIYWREDFTSDYKHQLIQRKTKNFLGTISYDKDCPNELILHYPIEFNEEFEGLVIPLFACVTDYFIDQKKLSFDSSAPIPLGPNSLKKQLAKSGLEYLLE